MRHRHLALFLNSPIRPLDRFLAKFGYLLSKVLYLLFFTIALFSTSCTPAASKTYDRATQKPYMINNQAYYPIPTAYGFTQTGTASWYGPDFHGQKTSNGEIYNMYDMTAAHKTLPMHTVLLVKNLENGREIVIRVNDRGPFVRGRIIDLSYSAAKRLRILGGGTARVHLTALGEAEKGQDQLMEMSERFYHGEYYVQIGAFINMENALRLQSRFTQAGHTTFIQKFYGQNAIYHRVHVYVGKTLQGATEARTILEQRGYRGAFVIAR